MVGGMETLGPIHVLWNYGVIQGVILGLILGSTICYFAQGDEKTELFPNEIKPNGTSKSIFGADSESAG